MVRALKLITFDVTGTLMVFRPSVAEKYAQSANKFGITVKTENVLQHFKNQWKILSKAHPNFGRNSLGWEKWWTKIVVETFRSAAPSSDGKKLEDLATYLIEEYKTPRCWALADGALNLLNFLKRSDTPIGVISNYDERLETTLKSLKIHSYFNFVIASYSAGVMKPDKQIFELARSQVEGTISPEQCMHIGNSIDFDYLGAKNAGWQSIYVGPPSDDVLKQVDKVDSIENLTELFEYFKSCKAIRGC